MQRLAISEVIVVVKLQWFEHPDLLLGQSNDIRFLTTLGSGDINCFIAGVENRTERASLGPFPSSTGLALVRWENTGGLED